MFGVAFEFDYVHRAAFDSLNDVGLTILLGSGVVDAGGVGFLLDHEYVGGLALALTADDAPFNDLNMHSQRSPAGA